MNFIISYEDAHPERGKIAYEDAVQLYLTYDFQWEYEKNEARQFRRFVQDNGVQLLTGNTDSEYTPS